VHRYWADFLLTITVAHGSFVVFLVAAPYSIEQGAALIISSLAIYRGVVFTHEIAHRPPGTFAAFTFVWNLLCGIPFLVPSFLYGDHRGHHANQIYGTWADPEYILRSRRWRLRVVVFLLLPLVYPIFSAIRFLLLTPLALVSRRVDRLVWTYASSLYVMNESYRRERDGTAASPSRWFQEIACCAWAWSLAYLFVSGRLPMAMAAKIYLVFLLWIALNQLRTLAAHRYGNQPDRPVSYLEQLLDTNTFPGGRWMPEFWAPLGLRYHALHHLLPMMPYHSLSEAHARLMTQLPPGSPYHRTVRRGLWPVVMGTLRRRSRSSIATLAADRPGSR
jgi:fatty acid desaturase